MTDLIPARVYQGDEVSKLLQFHAKQLGVDMRWTGKGTEDVVALLVKLFNSEVIRVAAVKALDAISTAAAEPEFPESLKASIAAAILNMSANIQLAKKAL